MTQILFGTKLTDMETCYKAFKAEVIKDVEIKSNRFDFEPEITAKVLKNMFVSMSFQYHIMRELMTKVKNRMERRCSGYLRINQIQTI